MTDKELNWFSWGTAAGCVIQRAWFTFQLGKPPNIEHPIYDTIVFVVVIVILTMVGNSIFGKRA